MFLFGLACFTVGVVVGAVGIVAIALVSMERKQQRESGGWQ